jgi:hypothetical protein
MMDFSGSAGAATSFDTLPADMVLFAILTVKGVKASNSGGGYLDCELTIDQGQPHAGRKIFDMIGDPQNAANSEKYREMGTIAITRILEAGRGAGPHNMAGYQIPNYEALSGLRVGIKTGIEKGTDGHADKNRVKEWLTPNPASQSGNKGWVKLMAGDHGGAAPVQQAQGGFGGFGGGQATGLPTGGFGNAAQGNQQAQTGGFGNGGAAQGAGSGFGQPAGNAAGTAANQSQQAGFAGATSPSDPGQTPGWLSQAGQ